MNGPKHLPFKLWAYHIAIVCDNGSESILKAMEVWADKNHVDLKFIEPGKATQNAFIEGFNGKFELNVWTNTGLKI